MIIPAGSRVRQRHEPTVYFRKSRKYQRAVAFNTKLVRQCIGRSGFIGLLFDEKKSEVTFVPCGKSFRGERAHRIVRDGGTPTATGRVIFLTGVAIDLLAAVPQGHYRATVRGEGFRITYKRPAEKKPP